MKEQLDMAQQVYQLVVNCLVTYAVQLLGAGLVIILTRMFKVGDASVNNDHRCRVPTQRCVELLHAVNLVVFSALRANQISMPFPQRQLSFISVAANSGA